MASFILDFINKDGKLRGIFFYFFFCFYHEDDECEDALGRVFFHFFFYFYFRNSKEIVKCVSLL